MIRLEQFTQADFKQLIEWITDEELLMNWSGSLFSFPLTEESLAWYIEDTNDPQTSDAFVYKAVDTESNEVVGHISLGGISRKNRSGRISRVLVGNTRERGRGVCQEMIKAVLKVGFEQLGLHRIALGVYDFNQGAIGCYTKAGMVLEGTSRDSLYFNGSYWSLTEMSMLEAEWEQRFGKHKTVPATA